MIEVHSKYDIFGQWALFEWIHWSGLGYTYDIREKRQNHRFWINLSFSIAFLWSLISARISIGVEKNKNKKPTKSSVNFCGGVFGVWLIEVRCRCQCRFTDDDSIWVCARFEESKYPQRQWWISKLESLIQQCVLFTRWLVRLQMLYINMIDRCSIAYNLPLYYFTLHIFIVTVHYGLNVLSFRSIKKYNHKYAKGTWK